MKKLILSAVFAFACFTANATSEVISNDDKNPKNNAKVVAKTKEQPAKLASNNDYEITGSKILDCPSGQVFVTVSVTVSVNGAARVAVDGKAVNSPAVKVEGAPVRVEQIFYRVLNGLTCN